MRTSIGQHAPVFLPGENPIPDRGAWQATVYRVTKSQTLLTMCLDARLLLACGSSAPVSAECEDGTAAWLVGTLAVPRVQGHRLPLPQELWPYQIFEPLVAGDKKASLASLSP